MSKLGVVIETTRRARGLTQAELAEGAGVTQAALSRWENDLREPDADNLDQLAKALGVTPRFLAYAGRPEAAMAVDAHMRRRQTAKPTVWRQLEAELNVLRMHASLIFEEVHLQSQMRIPTFDPIEVRASDAARLTRMQWRMPVGPVRNVVRWLEAAGCLVIERDFGNSRVDGLSQWVSDTPVIFMNSSVPTDRKRLTMAHELGHLVLHHEEMTPSLEDEANEFAAEFLMPMEVIRPQLRSLKIARLGDLKREWGVSMQALVERAYRDDLMTKEARTNFYKTMSIRGWRTVEPFSDELPPEEPELPAYIGKLLIERGLTPDDVAQMAGFDSARNNVLLPISTATRHMRLV
ncbi:ImmA/IrrE family metallo-endopeptidase [Kineococcus sp. R8]|uniref:XRE family transcriptional regulator n=1 Tax=Kineococcus siccus TaxID=2696567 RepID=UPI0014134C28|nr:XRE family transcriptional regulator [Kineococcus siccus]NAZ80574.1 ImmA/IrrE family metallo-endopeptidase [Kineococcus siccus]